MENEVKEEELFIPKTKHKGLKIILATLLIVGLIIGGYFLYQYKFNNPKTIVKTVIADAKERNEYLSSFQNLTITTSAPLYAVTLRITCVRPLCGQIQTLLL